MPQQMPTKAPSAKLDYRQEWGHWLSPGEHIVSHVLTVSPPGPVITSSQIVDGVTATGAPVTNGAVVFWMTGGAPGVRYKVLCHIVTTDDREDEDYLLIPVVDR